MRDAPGGRIDQRGLPPRIPSVPHAELVATLALALGAALACGAIARRIGLSPVLGYLIAGIALGPHSRLLHADPASAAQLAEIGIVLLMFGVGLHFSPRELAAVKAVAVPGAIIQAAAATGLGLAIGLAWHLSVGAGLVLGLCLAVASTVVLMRGLTEHHADRSPAGRLAVGWLIMEDLLTVVVLVVLPALAPRAGAEGRGIAGIVVVTLLKIGALAALVLVAGRRIVPWILDHVARLRSRELFTLAVLAIALGIAAGASALTGASLALGAFLAGMAVGQSELSLEAAADALPLRDAFAVLFFVSVGMLFDPEVVVAQSGLLLAALGLVVLVKPAIALVLVLALGHPLRAALTVAVGLAQIGEFSFILAGLGRDLGLLPASGESVILAVALGSIALNPLLFRLIEPIDAAIRASPRLQRLLAGPLPGSADEGLEGHVILCGYGRVSVMLRELLKHRGRRFVIIEQDHRVAWRLREEGLVVVRGDAANPLVLDHAGVARARTLVLGFGDPVATRLAAGHALDVNPGVHVLASAGSIAEEASLLRRPRVGAVIGEREAALELARLWLLEEGVGAIESEALLMDLRRSDGLPARVRTTRIAELRVPEKSPCIGRRLRDLGLPAGARIMSIERDGRHSIPQGDTALQAGDHVLVLTDDESLAAMEALLSPQAG